MESWLRVEPAAPGALWSHTAGLRDLVTPCVINPEIEDEAGAPSLRNWMLRWAVDGTEVVVPVAAHVLGPRQGRQQRCGGSRGVLVSGTGPDWVTAPRPGDCMGLKAWRSGGSCSCSIRGP
ncbi:hypothetical protein SCMC78_66720 [Streptomyces sp. CMC78]|uniref:Uncharacterized protein n=1 Tax=Streptomyces sp. CMC78 TaxID=3231512 RepID=A0AB33KW43_9ACTN